MINLEVIVNEDSSIGIGFTFTGLNDEAVTPNTFIWGLADIDGNIINNKEDESETPASTTWILLQADDLADISASLIRVITIYGTYNSTLGGVPRSNVTYAEEYSFDFNKIKNKSKP